MNEKFYSLPKEKQQRIINAGYRVFSTGTYKKSPVQEIADEAGISKSLLFFYFKNKKDLYMFLWDYACKMTFTYLKKYQCDNPGDLFEVMQAGANAKFFMMEEYPYLSTFTIKAFYEKDEEIRPLIQKSYKEQMTQKTSAVMADIDKEAFVPGLDIQMMIKDMYLASEGFVWEKLQQGKLDAKEMQREFQQLMEFWKSIYLKKGNGENEGH